MMKAEEMVLIEIMKRVSDENVIAVLLQSFIQEYGPLSDEAGELVRKNIEEACNG